MTEIMFIKTSSLGDVVHYMPAVTDVRRHLPNARLSWMVEEEYAPIARLHPAVDVVVPVATRRWRRQLTQASAWVEMAQFVRGVRGIRYDAVIDAQGLARSAITARTLRGRRHGYDRSSVREGIAAVLYDARHSVSRDLHAIERNRQLTALSLGYRVEGEPDYGLLANKLVRADPQPYAVLLHGSAQDRKKWPQPEWICVAKELRQQGLKICLPWGNGTERARSEEIAGALSEAEVPERQPLDQVAQLLNRAAVVVGVDTGLLHLAVAMTVPTVAIFVGSDPARTGPRGTGPVFIVGDRDRTPEAGAVLAAIHRILSTLPQSATPPSTLLQV